jgi:putative transposase
MITAAEQLGQQIGIAAACRYLKVSRSGLYRARQPQAEPKLRFQSSWALTEAERAEVREVLNSERFQDCTPRQIYATLLDDDKRYLCHWRTMYRILAACQEVRERRHHRRHPTYPKPELLATAPNQVWSWDITQLKGADKWLPFYLYVILDIFSRYVVGWLIADRESGELAQCLIAETCAKHGIQPDHLILHSDRGSPMKSAPVIQLLRDLGIEKSLARPHVSDDNPFSEAQFKTLKYRPDYPGRFATLDHARHWAKATFTWYNHQHYHSGLGLLTPASVHYGQAQTIVAQRQQVLQAAYAAHPERFVQGSPVVQQPPQEVWINPPKLDTRLLH